MTGTMADLLLLLLFITFILLLCTGFDRIIALPFLNPSRLEVKVLLVAIEDLVLPMGSFPINLLHPWAVRFPSTKSAAENSASEPATTIVPNEPMHVESGSTPNPMSHPTDLSSIRAGLNTTKLPSLAKPIPENGQPISLEHYSDEPFFDSLEYQQSLDEDSQIAGSEIELPHPEQNAATIGPLGGVATATGEQKDQQQQREKERSTAAMEKLLLETQAFKKSIRELVDPDGIYDLDLQKMIELVARIIERKKEAEESSRSEKVRSQREEEDLRHGWEDMKEVFERVINGQNATMKWTKQKHDEILEKNETLLSQNTASKEKYQRMMNRYNDNLRTLNDAKKWAEQEATTAKAEVESRINASKEKHRQERLTTEQNIGRERNTLLCKMRMVQDTLNNARCQVTLGEQKHGAAMKERNEVNKQLYATVKDLRLTLAAAQELSASTEQRLRKRLEDQCKEKDHEIGMLEDQQRDLSHETNMMRRSKISAEQDSQRLSDRFEKQMSSLRADKKRIEDRATREIEGLKKTIASDQVIINDLVEDIVRLKSGGEVQGLVSQLEASKEQLQQSAKDTQDAKKQLQERKREIKNLQETINARDKKIKQDAEISSTENETLKKQLEQAIRVSDSRLEEEARKLKEQETEFLRKFEMEKKEAVENAISKRAEDAKKEQEEHEKDEKDALQNAVNKAAEHAEKKEEQHKQESKDAVQKAVKKALEDARQSHQQQLEDERKSSREAQVKATKIQNEMRTEIDVLKSHVKQGAESKSADAASAQPGVDVEELIVQTREADEANKILLEIGRNGIAQDAVEHVVVQELSNAKLALYNLKCVLRKRGLDVVKDELVFVISSGKVDEQNIQQLNTTTWKELVKQAMWAQVRLRKVEDILATTSDLQKDSILEAINAPNREIRKARGPKRHTQQAPRMLSPTLPTGVQAALPTSGLQTPSNTIRDSASDQGVPRSTDDARSSRTPQRQGDQGKDALGLNLGDRAGVNFNVHDEGSGEAADPQGSANAESSSAQYTPFTGFRFGRHPPFRP